MNAGLLKLNQISQSLGMAFKKTFNCVVAAKPVLSF